MDPFSIYPCKYLGSIVVVVVLVVVGVERVCVCVCVCVCVFRGRDLEFSRVISHSTGCV